MALRVRNTTANRNTEENAVGLRKVKTTVTGLPKRAALGEISNVQQKPTTNLAKDAAEKKETKKPTIALNKQTTLASSRQTNSRLVQQTTQSLICKTTTAARPSRALLKPSVLGVAGVGSKPSVAAVQPKPSIAPALPKPRPRQPLKQSSTSSLLPKSEFYPSRITVPEVPVNCGFRDIDKESASNPILLGEYAGEIFAFLRAIETKFAVDEDFLKGQLVTPKMRSIVIDWLVDVQLQYSLLVETLHLAVGILDRFLQKYRTINKQKLQLVGVTSMWIACKYEELFSPELENFVYITDRAYTKTDIMKMEQLIHKTLDFSYGQPHSINFLRRYSNASKADSKQHTYAKYFLELALVSYRLRSVRPSLVAAVAFYISFCFMDENIKPGRHIWTECLEFYSTYTYDDLKPYIPVLAQIIIDAKTSKLQAVPKKYSSSKQFKVSSCVYLKMEILEMLAAKEVEDTLTAK